LASNDEGHPPWACAWPGAGFLFPAATSLTSARSPAERERETRTKPAKSAGVGQRTYDAGKLILEAVEAGEVPQETLDKLRNRHDPRVTIFQPTPRKTCAGKAPPRRFPDPSGIWTPLETRTPRQHKADAATGGLGCGQTPR